jgi:hypothetical protein
MSREQAVAAAQSAFRLMHGVTYNNGAWHWRRYGWKITISENGDLIDAMDEWL